MALARKMVNGPSKADEFIVAPPGAVIHCEHLYPPDKDHGVKAPCELMGLTP